MDKEEKRKIRRKINRYKRKMRKEEKKFGFISNGSGTRYIIPELLMELMELEEGKKYYKWFQQKFSDDYGSPELYLSWMALFYYSEEFNKAKEMMVKLIRRNIHVIPMIIKEDLDKIEGFSYFSNMAEPGWISKAMVENMSFINSDFRKWLRKEYKSSEIKQLVKEYIKLRKKLNKENDVDKRKEINNREKKLFQNVIKNIYD